MNRLKRLFAPPVFEDEEKTRVAGVLNVILLGILAIVVVYAIVSFITFPDPLPNLLTDSAIVLVVLGILFLMHRGNVRLASTLLSFALWGIVTLGTVVYSGLRGVSVSSYFGIVLIAGLLLGGQFGIGFAGLSVLAGLGMLYAEMQGIVLPSPTLTPFSVWVELAASLTGGAVLLHLANRSIVDALERARRNESVLAERNRELQESRDALEARTRELVAVEDTLLTRTQELESTLDELHGREAKLEEVVRRQEESNRQNQAANEIIRRRSAQLQAAAEVSRAIAQMRDPDRLLSQVTQSISRYFGFYHVGIFLIDEAGRDAVLRAANSPGGQRMLARSHRLEVRGKSIVGHVTGTGRPHIALDVGADAVYFDNPDLPDTRSEMALPLRWGNKIIGVLDIQSTEVGAFDDQDMAVLQALADQVSIVLENAQFFSQAQAALAEAESVNRRYLQQEWTRYVQQATDLSHEYVLSGRESLAGQPLPAGDAALAEGTTVVVSARADHQSAALAVPIKLRDQVIGVLDLQETDENRSWLEDEITLVEAVAEQLGLALENARLFEQTQARVQRETLVRQITERIRDAMDVDAMLQTAVRELGRALGAPKVYVRLGVDEEEVEMPSATTPNNPNGLNRVQGGK